MNCFYCKIGHTSRCDQAVVFGSPLLDGAQAEYVRVPLADGTVHKAPAEIDDKTLILMADIFPTGFFGARNAFNSLGNQDPSDATAVVIGCGPVGLCAIVSELEYKPKHLFAIDSIDSRLALAKSLGAEPLNFMTDKQGMQARIKEVTNGRGADIVIEVVGLSPALRTAFDLLRPFGFISSIGVHNAEVNKTTVSVFAPSLTWLRSHGPEKKHTSKVQYGLTFSLMTDNWIVRMCEFKWEDARSRRYSLMRLMC
jgi:threonine dehydrogenase-like Zn-dependent dehydrogenase